MDCQCSGGTRAGSSVGKKGGKSGSYEDWTFDDLRKRVKERGLIGVLRQEQIRTGVHAEESLTR